MSTRVRAVGLVGTLEESLSHRWFTNPDEDGAGPKAGNYVVGAAIPVLTVAWVLANDLPTVTAVVTTVVSMLVGAALTVLARWPVAALAITLVGTVGVLVAYQGCPPLVAASEVAVFGVAVVRPRREAVVAAFVSGVALFGAVWADASGPMTEPRTLIVAVWTVLALAAGDAVRTQRAYVSALAERARRAQETSEQEARARVAEERVRIARELHDVVAHHIAVINVHAGLARRALGRDAATVESSLGHVQEAARTVLDELGAVLRVLRAGDGEVPGNEPSPGMSRLDDLLATLSDAGFAVRTSTSGRPREMDPACGLAAFRIVQESLTNASKHGAGDQAELALVYGEDALTVTVRNPVRFDPTGESASSGTGGQGLIGMRERATSCGGSLTVRRDAEHGFRLSAVVPYRPRSPLEQVAEHEQEHEHVQEAS